MTWNSPHSLSRRDFLTGFSVAIAGLALPKRSWGASAGPIQIGAYKITVLSDGVRHMSADFLWPDVPENDLAEAFGQAQPPETIEFPNNVTLVEGEGRVILVDAGSGPNFDPATGRLEDALWEAGFAVDDITDLILTHGHPDHLWGALDDFEELPRFPNARHLMTASERNFWLGPMPTGVPSFHPTMALGAQRVLGELADVIEAVPSDFNVAPGVDLIPTPGHTPGHVAIRIESGGESLLVVGDALTNARISFTRPDWPVATDTDTDEAIATRQRLLDMLASDQSLLVGFHLPWPGRGRVVRTGDGFAFASDET